MARSPLSATARYQEGARQGDRDVAVVGSVGLDELLLESQHNVGTQLVLVRNVEKALWGGRRPSSRPSSRAIQRARQREQNASAQATPGRPTTTTTYVRQQLAFGCVGGQQDARLERRRPVA